MTRVIKLQPEYRQTRDQKSPVKVPKLTLSGEWLRDAGFEHGQVVHVTVENGRLTIQNP